MIQHDVDSRSVSPINHRAGLQTRERELLEEAMAEEESYEPLLADDLEKAVQQRLQELGEPDDEVSDTVMQLRKQAAELRATLHKLQN
mgnify:CR=1 FL=1